MALTLEEERILKGTRGISNQQLVIQIYRILSFVCKLSYQSGKDRSGFDFRGGRILKETCGNSNQQMMKIISCLHKGVRRENCQKNVWVLLLILFLLR
uniref:Uncharacterized protein n=1 Tax=Meloidogyne enterolobii TaxID=390850 RepID=A0A6V7YCN9_MELEN|nr:unnamed protein product [Meloidogyne enterolobii]